MRRPVRDLLLLFLGLTASALAACYTGPDVGASNGAPSAAAPTAPAPSLGAENGLPCEVKTLLEKRCAQCHSSPPRSGAKTSTMTRTDLLGDWEGRPLGEVSLERMRDEESPMPPDGLLSESELASFEQWIEAGMPEGTCGAVPSVEHTPPKLTCTSARFWTEGDDEGDELMTPGQACISCHTQENLEHANKTKDDDDDDDDDDDEDDDDDDELEAPAFSAAGTVYPTLHEPDDCFGVNGTTGATKIVLEGADGRKLTLSVNRAGNFMTEQPLALPYRASITRGGKTRIMKLEQTDGDCNHCHTAEGGDAPGRILAP